MVAANPQTGKSPEALVKILVTVIEKTPSGGATREDIKEAYLDAKDFLPTERTIYRNIRRINKLFNPAAFAKGGKNKKKSKDKLPMMIRSFRDGTGQTRYIYSGKKLISNDESSQALTLILGLYSQQKGILKDHFEKVIGSLLLEMMAKSDGDYSFFSDIDEHIHVSGYGSVEPKKLLRRISEIIRAIENCKVVKVDYARTYDGATRNREVEPYGLVCRHGSWYLVGRCRIQQKRRIYQLDQVRRLKVEENSVFKRPAGLSMTDIFKDAWGIWNIDDDKEAVAETVRIKVKKGVAERFKAVSFHDSQQMKSLPNGEAEVTYKISGPGEMVPWLMSWGQAVEVLEPGWLRDELVKNFQDAAEVYQP